MDYGINQGVRQSDVVNMNIYIDLINRRAMTSPTDATPPIRPDFRAPTTYPINLYFMRSNGAGGYNYVRFANSVIGLGLRSNAPMETARFTLSFRGAETSEIDTRFSVDQIRGLLEALPTVGAGNVSLAILDGSMIVEFVGELAGLVLPTMSARVASSTPGAELGITVLPVTDFATNSRQQLTLRRAALAQVTIWNEVTVGTTPGWAGTLDTTAVPVSAWENPVGDILLEVRLSAVTPRGGSDAATAGDGIARSGTNGQSVSSPGATGIARANDNGTDSFLIAADSDGVYGRKFTQNDVGRDITDVDGYLWPATTIAEVIDDGRNNAARLSQRLTPEGIGLSDTISYTLAALPSDVYYSATANFTAADVGHIITGVNIPAGTRITALINAQYVRLSQRATTIATGLSWSLASEISNVFTAASGSFQSIDVGAKINAPAVLDGDATITGFISPTQVVLDKRPKSTATGVTWKLLPVRPYPPPTVTRISIGSATAQEIQKIALSQAAIGGTLAIQDGYGGTMPLLNLVNPVGASDLQNALNNAYPNYGECRVTEVVPGAEWNVQFGTIGNQRLLFVSEVSATYGEALLNWIIIDKAQAPEAEIPTIPEVVPLKTTRNGLIYIGANPNEENPFTPVGQPRITRATDGTNASILRQRFMAYADKYTATSLNTTISVGGVTFYVVGEEGMQEKNGMVIFDRVAVTLPDARTELHNHQRPYIFPARTYQGATLLDVQLCSVSLSGGCFIRYSYYHQSSAPSQPNDGPGATVVHFQAVGNALAEARLLTWSTFNWTWGTWGVYQTWGWSRRRWMGNIWEQQIITDTNALPPHP